VHFLKNRPHARWLCVLLLLCAPGCEPSGAGPVIIAAPGDGAVFEGGEKITFSAGIDRAEVEAAKIMWDFGDDTAAAGCTVTHAYDMKGSYAVRLSVTDVLDEVHTDSISLAVASSRFIKTGVGGAVLPDDAAQWTAVQDVLTGLVWEVKHNRDGIENYADPQDADNSYTWHDDNPETNGGDPGTDGDGTDTRDFIDALNACAFSGFADWRMPTCEELAALLDPQRFNPAINTACFPATVPWYYWSSSTYDDFAYAACHIYFMGSPAASSRALFNTATNHYGMKDLLYHARAVRDGAADGPVGGADTQAAAGN